MASFRETIKDVTKVLNTIDGIRSSETIPDSVPEDIFAYVSPEEGDFDNTFGGDDQYQLVITVLSKCASLNERTKKLYPKIDVLKDKFNTKQNLNGTVSWACITGFRNFGEYDFAGETVLGMEFLLTVQD